MLYLPLQLGGVLTERNPAYLRGNSSKNKEMNVLKTNRQKLMPF